MLLHPCLFFHLLVFVIFASSLDFKRQWICKPASKFPFRLKATPEKDYSSSVFLPTTTFEQRANAATKELQIQQWWDEKGICDEILREGGDPFVLHDGPPYANGDLHMGHALNKILKDFINRYQILKGRHVTYIPGWDCHGLPIELKVLTTLDDTTRKSLHPLTLRKTAASFAKQTVMNQMSSFKRYGIWGNWTNYYTTMSPSYEAAQIRVFGEMVQKGHIYRGRKPVHWSPSSQSALAEAELEYPENHRSRSIYVAFEVVQTNYLTLSLPTYLVIWTTTPWTIPANLAIAINPNISYAIVCHPSILRGSPLILAEDALGRLVSKFGLQNGESFEILSVIPGQKLEKIVYKHPLNGRELQVVIGGEYITPESGTGLVHIAPGHGEEDYLIGLQYGLEIFSPVDNRGCFTVEAGPDLSGKEVLSEGNLCVIRSLRERQSLIAEELYSHKYPYDWRTKLPTIFRSTDQWFASVQSFKSEALRAVDSVQWIPRIGKNRITSMIESRGDWCISRQRSWGVPIPVFYRKDSGEPLLSIETINHIEKVFRDHGSDAWWELDLIELLPESYRDIAHDYVKGTDTMDVWFDSGTSWAGVLQSREDVRFPADLYLEGSDQSRGWFQSSLLTCVATQGTAPYKRVLTHGFVLDEKGTKMSKSLGNVVDPKDIIEGGKNRKKDPAYGADTLRLWVAGADYTSDVCIGSNIIKQAAESYRKIRNTLRYLLGSLADFNPTNDSISYNLLPSIDRYILGLLTNLVKEVEVAYEEFQFSKIYQLIMQFIVVDVSSFYLDVSKDRLYISGRQTYRRRATQTVMNEILNQMLLILAPILPHLAEEAWLNFPYPTNTTSIFQQKWSARNSYVNSDADRQRWEQLRDLKNIVNKGIEKARNAKIVGAASEVKLSLWTNDSVLRSLWVDMMGEDDLLPEFHLTNGIDDLRFILSVSEIEILPEIGQENKEDSSITESFSRGDTELTIVVRKTPSSKCQRCWFHAKSVGSSTDFPQTCQRCSEILRKQNFIKRC